MLPFCAAVQIAGRAIIQGHASATRAGSAFHPSVRIKYAIRSEALIEVAAAFSRPRDRRKPGGRMIRRVRQAANRVCNEVAGHGGGDG